MAQPHTQRVKLSTYLLTYVVLIALATVSLFLKGLPEPLAVALSLVIAGVKAVAVLLHFMHLIEERFSTRYVMVVSSVLVGILIILTTLDPLTRGPFPPGPSRNPSFVEGAILSP